MWSKLKGAASWCNWHQWLPFWFCQNQAGKKYYAVNIKKTLCLSKLVWLYYVWCRSKCQRLKMQKNCKRGICPLAWFRSSKYNEIRWCYFWGWRTRYENCRLECRKAKAQEGFCLPVNDRRQIFLSSQKRMNRCVWIIDIAFKSSGWLKFSQCSLTIDPLKSLQTFGGIK